MCVLSVCACVHVCCTHVSTCEHVPLCVYMEARARHQLFPSIALFLNTLLPGERVSH